MTSAKIQRWTDLRVGLLRHRLGATFTELADADWALWHVLQYASEAEVLESANDRRAMAERLRAMLVITCGQTAERVNMPLRNAT